MPKDSRRAIDAAWRQAESKTETDMAEEPVFSCNPGNPRGSFRLKQGKWAGKTWVARLTCCSNPLCHCSNVDFLCATDDGTEHPAIQAISLDPIARTATPAADNDRNDDSPALAEAVAREFGNEDWKRLYQFLLAWKRDVIQKMDVFKLRPPIFSDMLSDNGTMVGFADIFPFAESFEFKLNGEPWAVDDQYCVMPDCECREAALSFLHLVAPPDGSGEIPQDQVPVTRYNYKTGAITPWRYWRRNRTRHTRMKYH